MDRNDDANEGASSPDTVTGGRSSSDEDRRRNPGGTSGDYVTVEGSSSSLDTLTSGCHVGMEEKKRGGRFGALKNSFRKEGGLFKIKKRSSAQNQLAGVSVESVEAARVKDGARRKSPEVEAATAAEVERNKERKKKKKSHSLVRKLSLSKFKLSSEHETRHTPEGGDSSRSQSQSSQDSPGRSDSPSKVEARRGPERGKIDKEGTSGGKAVVEGGLLEVKPDKPISTVTVVQRKSPSLTIRSAIPDAERPARANESSQPPPETREKVQCAVSTLPYALSKWPAQGTSDAARPTDAKKHKLTVKSDSESSVAPRTPPAELRRKLSLLEEKRAIFQRRRFETSEDVSCDTVIGVTADDDNRSRVAETLQPESSKRRARHISVSKFDTFSTFEGTFDEDTGLGYLAGIEEDYRESYEHQSDYFEGAMALLLPAAGDSLGSEKNRSVSQESASSEKNAPSAGLGEKREHLYKILVIGELGAGKTSIIKRYVHQFFSQHYRATIGVDFALKVLNWDPHTIIRLQLWDIAGQERFGNMTRVYYKEAVGAFIVFDVTRSATLEAVVKWKQDLDSKVQLPDGSPIPCVLLANKCDQQKEGLVNSPAKMDEYCKEKNFAGWFETSAKENINIEEAARFLVNKILQNDQIMKGNGSQEQNDGERFALNQTTNSPKKSCAC